jgi:uncharacterized protein YegP (UPF0339 family)
MTRAKQVTQAVSAMRKARADTDSSPQPAAMTFVIYEDNVGGYHWRIVADDGETLVRSASFGSYEDAKQAARIVHRGASRATFEDSSGPPPPADLPSRRHRITVTLRDRQDAERWLDEGGSFSSEAVAR